ncbi:hypothetical protein SARC_03516 [Sphaeroforma arctica JP610]|uniref:Amine oxidase domain-containing protein n=1 Tax=Sphaeroforma arctica JP610 TaxID=667725 RepID=A0A0L0G7R1_9EUKA|nr:hypothetical protein SARC_03516 [Sphaeroforma arctica JP610]KNC84268.1 hypothetical protein SARC_03516 [Sphaeroforma arctica JP610]|eukprot:XP_014158170.1 hypothetical protein SARC_03516 [Sphaeroforma arctica JP610]
MKLSQAAICVIVAFLGFGNALPETSAKTARCAIDPVIIIGAGKAGAAATRDLTTRGCKVVVVEARDRVGGRAHIIQDWGSGFPLDTGGTYIHGGSVDNSVRWVAEKKLGLKTIESGGDSAYIGPEDRMKWTKASNGEAYTEGVMELGWAAYEDWWECVAKLEADRLAKGQQDVSLAWATNEVMNGFLMRDDTFVKMAEMNTDTTYLLFIHLNKVFEGDWGLPLSQFKLFGFKDDYHWRTIEEGDRVIVGGMQQVPAALLKDINLVLNYRVTRIDYIDTKNPIITVEGTSGEDRNITSGITIISTLPLEILTARDVEFVAPLPANKRLSTNRRGIARLNNLHLEFPSRFWEEDLGTMTLVPQESDPRHDAFLGEWIWTGSLLQIKGKHDSTDAKSDTYQPALSFFWASDDYWHESLSDKELKNMALKKLIMRYGKENVLEPTSYIASRWNTDPYTKLAYSGLRLYSTKEDWENLAAPINNALFFAGEHTNLDGRYQTLDGAYDSGIRAAKEVAGLTENGLGKIVSEWENPTKKTK